MDALVYILLAFAALLVIFVAVLITRTLGFKPHKSVTPSDEAIEFDAARATEALRALVRCRTVSSFNPEDEDEEEFKRLVAALPELYPDVYRVCEFTDVGDRGLLFRWRGRTDGDPTVLMSHYDVVPVNEDAWTHPPFDADVIDGVLYGRGSLDTKVTFNSIMFSANHLIAEGFTPEHDIYFAFSGNEEVNGNGAVRIVEYFERNGITPALVLDEGGAVVNNVFPGVKTPCALIGIAEKGLINLELKVKSQGGHASAPKPHTPVGVLSRACCRIEAKPPKAKLTEPVSQMFDTLGRHSTFIYRLIFANLWCTSVLLDVMAKRGGGDMNALLRTTVAFTQMTGSSAPNVIPPEASMVANMRLNPHDSVAGICDYVKHTIADDTISVSPINSSEPSRISTTDCEGYTRLTRAIASTWRDTIISPYLMMQCSDSRHWGRISDKVYRFSAMDLTKEERASIHGNDERIRLDCLKRSVEFYVRLMKDC